MHIESVSSGSTVRPSSPSKRLAVYDGSEAFEKGRRETGLDRRQRDPTRTKAQHPVPVQQGNVGCVLARPEGQCLGPSLKVRL